MTYPFYPTTTQNIIRDSKKAFEEAFKPENYEKADGVIIKSTPLGNNPFFEAMKKDVNRDPNNSLINYQYQLREEGEMVVFSTSDYTTWLEKVAKTSNIELVKRVSLEEFSNYLKDNGWEKLNKNGENWKYCHENLKGVTVNVSSKYANNHNYAKLTSYKQLANHLGKDKRELIVEVCLFVDGWYDQYNRCNEQKGD